MKLKAYAKLNLSLRVFKKRSDGFHNIESVMQSVSLFDSITLSLIPSAIEVACDDPKVPKGKENIAYRAAELFLKTVSGCKIHIEKNIPMAAGLAGGSADAAAVLFGLNQLMARDRRLTTGELLKLGAQVGADVPFCLTGGTCLVKGKGEIVEKQQPWPKTYFVLVCPDVQVSTKWAYEEFDRMHLNLPEEIKNDLEPVVVSRYEIVTEIKEKLLGLGCSEAQMSGSGPSVFGVVRHKADAEGIFDKVKEEYPRSFLVETVDNGLELL
ncbi:MAG: 4-(cytidine 5'-diphospho)-2-C-methyl-D-erythritol kinase [Candidatus Margulisiibacteriota bacterium]